MSTYKLYTIKVRCSASAWRALFSMLGTWQSNSASERSILETKEHRDHDPV